MLQTAFNRNINNFRGFSREVWILTIITFINRAGTMVMPFLSKYLKENLGFSYDQVGWIISCFGLGSMIGSWIGGRLSDTIGFYKIMVFSLFTTGILFFVIQQITTFPMLCVAMFFIMVIADMYRPAMFVSIRTYAKPENRTRAMTLVRLAINLGMTAGPALAGYIILSIGYKGLFWADGTSCIIAILLFCLLVKEKKKTEDLTPPTAETSVAKSPLHDVPFLVFMYVSFIVGVVFFQLFTALPLYHNIQYGWSEANTGLLISANGLMIFFFEMPIVSFMERHNIAKIKVVLWGSLCMALAFFVLLCKSWAGILLVNMLFLTIGEMFCFPFSNSFALGRAPRGQEGRYMALYTMTFSLAHIFSAKTSMYIIETYGYTANWVVMGFFGLTAVAACIYLHSRLLK
jgi:predicted MFS family arabinose efflux permease